MATEPPYPVADGYLPRWVYDRDRLELLARLDKSDARADERFDEIIGEIKELRSAEQRRSGEVMAVKSIPVILAAFAAIASVAALFIR